ncbi:MAG: hypothetical protein HW390_1092 [Candidatus Brocadiaceae bacterium]|nr:hypothetical protein [Candidatus Brocadiaceae bacterium]
MLSLYISPLLLQLVKNLRRFGTSSFPAPGGATTSTEGKKKSQYSPYLSDYLVLFSRHVADYFQDGWEGDVMPIAWPKAATAPQQANQRKQSTGISKQGHGAHVPACEQKSRPRPDLRWFSYRCKSQAGTDKQGLSMPPNIPPLNKHILVSNTGKSVTYLNKRFVSGSTPNCRSRRKIRVSARMI